MIKLPSFGIDKVHDNDGELELRNRLKAARAEAGLSQTDLARLVGVSRQTISSIETGLFNPYRQAGARPVHRARQEVRGPVLFRLTASIEVIILDINSLIM